MNRDPGLIGPSNFRDLGGYATADGRAVRWRRVFRADALRFTDDDVVVVRDQLRVRTAIDLRTPIEYGGLDGGGKPPYVERLAAAGITRVALPTVDETRLVRQAADHRPIAAKSYLKMFERGGPAMAEAVRIIADTDRGPVVFHCAAGKDRTGILAALLLGLLGVDDRTIVEDYALSQANMARARAKIAARPDGAEILARRPPSSFEAPTDAIVGFVEGVRSTHGDWLAAAASIGLDDDVVSRLQDHLLDP